MVNKMANATVSRIGAVNKDSTATDAAQQALFLKVFSGEVLASFYANTVMEGKILNRNIASGKSASFPAVGKTSASFHTPGAEIVGTAIGHNEIVITIDGLLLASAFIASIDEAMNHFDVRSYYTEAIGQSLAQEYDKYALQEALLGARASATITGNPGGTAITDANLGSGTLATKATAIAQAIFNGAKQLDINNCTTGARYCFLKPTEYYALIQGKDAVNKDWAGAMSGGWAEGTITKLAGVEIVMTNNLPTTDLSGNTYHGVNAATTLGIIGVQNAVGCVKLMDISSESQWDIRRQGTLMVSKAAVGYKYLRPEGLIELKTS